MRYVMMLAVVAVVGCQTGEPPVTRAPNLITVDRSLIGVDLAYLSGRLGSPCMKVLRPDAGLPDGGDALVAAVWTRVEDTVMQACWPMDVLVVSFDKDNVSDGYYVGPP